MDNDKKVKKVPVLRRPPAWKVWVPGTRTHDLLVYVASCGPVALLANGGWKPPDGASLVTLFTLLFLWFLIYSSMARARSSRWEEFKLHSSGLDELKTVRRWSAFISLTRVLFEAGTLLALYSVAAGYWANESVLWNWGLRSSASAVLWLLVRDHADQYGGLLRWTSTERASRELQDTQAEVLKMAGRELDLTTTAVTLEHRDLLARLAAQDHVLSLQLAVLGLRPETVNPVPLSWWARVPEGPAAVDDGVETDEAIVASNDALLMSLKLLIKTGLLRLDSGRLRVTIEGREAVAMPPSLAISRLPAHIRAELARADLKFYARDYEGSAAICGNALEAFLKSAIRQLHPDAGRRRKLLQLMEVPDLEKATLGPLAAATATYLGVLSHLGAEESEKRRRWVASSGFDPKPSEGFAKDRRQSFARLLQVCVELRNEWLHHNPEFRGNLSRQVEDAYRLLHLSRITVSSFCAESGIDPFFVPAASTAHERSETSDAA
ncbi:MAG: hypothetical protein RL653_2493 [Pseudomonadota bacterium]|jgi:hypothetical protein